MSEKKNNSLLGFVKRNLYYLVIGASLIIVATTIAVVLLSNGGGTQTGGKTSESFVESEEESEAESQKPIESESEKPGQSGSESQTPTQTKIVFAVPVANSTVSKSYTSSTVVFNKTLGVYTGHMGIDFSADAGADVVAVYDGTVENITTSYLEGTTITINHGDGLKTLYNSVEAAEGLAVGQKVKKGQVIGSVSDNNRQEYKDGAHLHFEAIEDGKRIDPETYLLLSEK